MAVLSHRNPVPELLPRRPDLRVIESRRRAAKLHLFTYLVVNAIFWTLWAAAFVSAEAWYWWLVVPLVGWTIVLALHLWHVAPHALRTSDASPR
jgi:hypothetical protein